MFSVKKIFANVKKSHQNSSNLLQNLEKMSSKVISMAIAEEAFVEAQESFNEEGPDPDLDGEV